jgi:hypothetical protein
MCRPPPAAIGRDRMSRRRKVELYIDRPTARPGQQQQRAKPTDRPTDRPTNL